MTHESMLRAYSELEDQIAKLFTTDIETEQSVLKIYSNSVMLPISEYGRLWESAMQIRPVKPHGESHRGAIHFSRTMTKFAWLNIETGGRYSAFHSKPLIKF